MAAHSVISLASLPSHGPIACRRCFETDKPVAERGAWRIVNDPGAWGSANPTVLVLGFSKGFTQADATRSGRFEDVPFKRMRTRLTEVLRAIGVLGPAEIVDNRMVASERDLAFGSLVRCSLSRRNDRTGRYECTGPIMPKAFVEPAVAPVLRRCAQQHIATLPTSVRLVIMLGTSDDYIARCRELIRSTVKFQFRDVNDVAYGTGPVTWVHVSHPSGLNGHHPAWMAGGPDKQGRKRGLAQAAVRAALD